MVAFLMIILQYLGRDDSNVWSKIIYHLNPLNESNFRANSILICTFIFCERDPWLMQQTKLKFQLLIGLDKIKKIYIGFE